MVSASHRPARTLLRAPRELYAARRDIEWSGHPAGLILAEAVTRTE